MRRETEAAVEHEAERERMSAAERRFDGQSIEDLQTDASTHEYLGGFEPESLLDDEKPPTG